MSGTRIFLVVALSLIGAVKINGSNNQGRLLMPEEGCGFRSQVLNARTFSMQNQDSWPWIASVLSSSDTKTLVSNCTGTLITSRHVLTSANCVGHQPLFVRLGETPKTNENIFHDYVVSKWMVHPKSKATELKNNIAILFLAKDVEFSDRIAPACLPTKISMLSERIGDFYRLVRKKSFDASKSAVYKPKNYTQVENEYCEQNECSAHLLDQTSFCAQGDDMSGNQGDPFVVRVKGKNGTNPIYQIGLDAVHLRMNPGIFLNLYPYVEWISDIVSGKISTPGKNPGKKVAMEVEHPQLLPPVGCGLQPVPTNPNEIVNRSGNWPWMGVILTYSAVNRELQIKCSASLITNKHLLTSANCVNDRVRSVRLGDPQSFTDYKVNRMEVHPGAKWSEYEDNLAILFLERDVKFSDQIRPVCLPFNAQNLSDSTLYRLYSNNSKVSQPTGFNTKRYTIVSNNKCRSYNIPFTDAVFCAQVQGDTQTGMDGDPFMQAIKEDSIYPIYQVALGVYQMDENPTIFVNIHPYIGWIKDTINGNVEKTRNEVILPFLRPKEFSTLFEIKLPVPKI